MNPLRKPTSKRLDMIMSEIPIAIKKLPNLGEDLLFFLENTLILGQKLKITSLNLSEDLFF